MNDHLFRQVRNRAIRIFRRHVTRRVVVHDNFSSNKGHLRPDRLEDAPATFARGRLVQTIRVANGQVHTKFHLIILNNFNHDGPTYQALTRSCQLRRAGFLGKDERLVRLVLIRSNAELVYVKPSVERFRFDRVAANCQLRLIFLVYIDNLYHQYDLEYFA